MSERTYSEAETAAILQRAMARREADRRRVAPLADAAGAAATGLTLAELQAAAAEVGLEGRYVQEAALEVDIGETAATSESLWSDRIEIERAVAAPPTEAAWARIEADLARRMDTLGGETRRYPGGWEWTHKDTEGDVVLRASLTERGGASHLRIVRASAGPLGAAAIAGGSGAVLAFVVAAATGWPSVLLLVLGVALGAAAGFFGGKALRGAKATNLQRLADEAERHLRDVAPAPEAALGAPAAPEARQVTAPGARPTLDVDTEPTPEAEPGAAASRARQRS